MSEIQTTDPTLEGVIESGVRWVLGQIGGTVPATVLEYNRASQSATVVLDHRELFQDPDTGDILDSSPATIGTVPVLHHAGTAGSIVIDISAGDKVVLMVSKRSLDEWKSGLDNIRPQSFRSFDLTDAFAIPGGQPPSSPLPSLAYAAGAVVVSGGDVRLGDSTAVSSGEAVVLQRQINELVQLLDNHTHANFTSGPVLALVPTDYFELGTLTLPAQKVKAV